MSADEEDYNEFSLYKPLAERNPFSGAVLRQLQDSGDSFSYSTDVG